MVNVMKSGPTEVKVLDYTPERNVAPRQQPQLEDFYQYEE